jgi:hypothetical protein
MVPVLSEPAIRVSPRGTRGVRIPSRGPVPVVFNLGGKLLIRMYCRIGGLWSRPGFRMVLLTTRGARTGRMRTVPLGGFSDRRGSLACRRLSGWSGASPGMPLQHGEAPRGGLVGGWARAVQSAPGDAGRIRPRRRARRIATIAPPYAAYQTKTDREIPIVRLTQEEGREHGTGRLEWDRHADSS